jgi:hypothetical protein
MELSLQSSQSSTMQSSTMQSSTMQKETEKEIICGLCESGSEEEKLMLCDGCDKGFHSFCLNLPGVPTGTWFCPACKRLGRVLATTTKETFELKPRQQIYLYERVSSKGQNEPQYGRVGLDTQNDTLLKFVLERGLMIKETCQEVGSARGKLTKENQLESNRKCLNALIAKLKKGDCILVYSVSRFSRN